MYPLLHIQMEDSNDQLVRIEASPQNKNNVTQSQKKRKMSSIKVSPVKSASSPIYLSPNKHRSPCHNRRDGGHKAAASIMLMAKPNAVTVAPVVHQDIAKQPRAKACSPTA